MTSGWQHKRDSTIAFRVDSVSASLSYAPASNHDPDGDSDGTTIAVTR